MKKSKNSSSNSSDIFSFIRPTEEIPTSQPRFAPSDIEPGTCCGMNIEHIDWPKGITHIGHDAFAHCENLKTAVIPDTVTLIGERAFTECLSLNSITFSKRMSAIPLGCCAECLTLESVTIPSNIRTIGYGAFCKCLSLKK